MPLQLKQESKMIDRPLIKQGMHPVRCFFIVDLGTQKEDYGGHKKELRKIRIGWEILDQKYSYEKDGETVELPQTIYQNFTLSMYEKANLYKLLVSWRGKEFTPKELQGFLLKNLLNAPGEMLVKHKEKEDGTVRNEISDILKWDKKEKGECPKMENDPIFFSLERDDHDPQTFEMLWSWIQEIIQKSPEWKSLQSGGSISKINSTESLYEKVQQDSDDYYKAFQHMEHAIFGKVKPQYPNENDEDGWKALYDLAIEHTIKDDGLPF